MADYDEKEVERIQKRLRLLEDQTADLVEARLVRGLAALSKRIERALARLDVNPDGTVSPTPENLQIAQNFVTSAGPALQALAQDGRENVIAQIAETTEGLKETLTAAGFDADELGNRVDKAVLGAFLDLDLRRFNNAGNATQNALSDAIFRTLSGSPDFDDLVRAVEQTLVGVEDRAGNPMTRHAKTFVVTAMNSYQGNFFQQALPDDEDLGGWFYSGPGPEAANRDFCLARVGKYMRDVDIRSDISNNPIGASNMNNPGGFNCRHQLIPVPTDVFKIKEKEQGGRFTSNAGEG